MSFIASLEIKIHAYTVLCKWARTNSFSHLPLPVMSDICLFLLYQVLNFDKTCPKLKATISPRNLFGEPSTA